MSAVSASSVAPTTFALRSAARNSTRRHSSFRATSPFHRALSPRATRRFTERFTGVTFAHSDAASNVVPVDDNATGRWDSSSDEGLGLTFLVHRVKSIASTEPTFDAIYEAFPSDPYVDPGVGRSRTYSDLLYFPSPRAGEQADHVRCVGKNEDPFSQHFVPPESYKFVGREGEEEEAVDGSKARRFDPLPEELVELPQMRELLRRFVQYVRLDGEQFAYNSVFRIGCHAIRISAAPDGEKGDPAPEGIHQDGFDYIAIAVVGRHNVKGGEILVHMPEEEEGGGGGGGGGATPPSNDPVFVNALRPGELVFINDRNIWHNANKIACADKAEGPGHVDFLVLTLDGGLNRPIFPWELDEVKERKKGDIAHRPASRAAGVARRSPR